MGLPLRGMTRKLRFWNRTRSLLGRVVSRGGGAGGNVSGVAGYVTSDVQLGSYILAVFFVFFLTVMLTTQLVMMHDEMPSSDGNSHEPGLRLMRALRVERRQANRVGGLGRTLAALSSGPYHALLVDDLMHPTLTTGRWNQKSAGVIAAGYFNQDQDWVHSMWFCLRKSDGPSRCPWQPVVEASDKFYVYSAYFDDYRVKDPLVRIIGVARNKKSDQVWCHLGFSSTNGTTRWWRVGASVRPIREHWNLRYSAVFILCPLKGVTGVPDIISVSATASSVMPQTLLPDIAASDSFSYSNETYRPWLYTPTGNLLPLTHRNRSIARDPDNRLFFLGRY